MPMIPPSATHQEKGQNRKTGKYYEPENVKAARSKLIAYLAGHRPEVPIEGPVALITIWQFPITGKHRDGEWKTSKPDTDNSVKLLKDCMTHLHFWKDDAQVASELIMKRWSIHPGIYIKVKEIIDETVPDD